MSFLQHSLCQCKQSADPSVQISNFIVATALKILTMGFFVSFLTQGKNPTKTQEDLMMNTLTPFQTLSVRLFFWTKWCLLPCIKLFAAGGQYCANKCKRMWMFEIKRQIASFCLACSKTLNGSSDGDGGIKILNFGKPCQPCSLELMVSLKLHWQVNTKIMPGVSVLYLAGK